MEDIREFREYLGYLHPEPGTAGYPRDSWFQWVTIDRALRYSLSTGQPLPPRHPERVFVTAYPAVSLGRAGSGTLTTHADGELESDLWSWGWGMGSETHWYDPQAEGALCRIPMTSIKSGSTVMTWGEYKELKGYGRYNDG
jgi:hypothetical protein